jgi:amino acid permease
MQILSTLLIAFAAFTTGFSHKSYQSSPVKRSGRSVMMTAAAVTDKKSMSEGATISSSTFNLAKSIIGAGVLSLPSSVAYFSDKPASLIPAGLISLTMGLVAAYSFSLIGKACDQHKADSFQDAWAKSVDPKSAWLISFAITCKCFLASLAYSIIIGDSFSAIFKTFNAPVFLTQRTNVILAITSFVLLPLCSLKSLAALAPFSLLGLGGTLYTAIFMAIRYFDGSYAPGGKFFKLLAVSARPSFGVKGNGDLSKISILVSMLSTAYIAHYNAPRFLKELKEPTLPRYNQVVAQAFIASIVTFIFMKSIGFLTFGGSSMGFILNNYASSDILATFARLAIGLALLTGYPFTFAALKDGIMDLTKTAPENRAGLSNVLTLGLLSLVTLLALVLKDVGIVVSISGALFGAALMFMVPAIMNICNSKALQKQGKVGSSKAEIALNYGMVVSGFFVAVLGVTVSVLRQTGRM